MSPKAIVDRLERAIGIGGSPRNILLAIEDCLYVSGICTRIEAATTAEQTRSRVVALISLRASVAEAEGTTSILTILGSTEDSVAGFSYLLNEDGQAVSAAKKQRQHTHELLLAIKKLTFQQFERFGAKVLILMGAASAQVTPHAGDQGIDFHGYLTLGQFSGLPAPFMRLTHDVRLSFAGQAKHYPNSNLGPDIVRELAGAVSLARSGAFSTTEVDFFHDAGFKPHSPIVIILFTSGGLSSGARQLANSAGIIAKSGDQLAVFLADHGVGMSDVADELTFDPAAFGDWVAG